MDNFLGSRRCLELFVKNHLTTLDSIRIELQCHYDCHSCCHLRVVTDPAVGHIWIGGAFCDINDTCEYCDIL